MQDTVDPAAALPRTLAQIIEDTRRAVCSLYPLQRGQGRTCLSLRANRGLIVVVGLVGQDDR
jgi:hypothetical protein